MRRFFWIYAFLTFVITVRAQAQQAAAPAYAREFSFTTDNDAYLFRKDDAYYTNGFFFSLRKAKERNGKKIVRDWELAQKIYTPLIRRTTGPADIDRPYCGYLYLDFSETQFSNNRDDVWRYHASIGQVGPASLGEEVQNGYHSMLGYLRFLGWQYQVQNALGADVGATYARTILEDSSWFKLVPTVQATLGMNHTDATLGAWLCFGAFERNANSALWKASTQTNAVNTRRKYEFYFFANPEIMWQGYNATVQGGLLSKGSGAVLGDPERIVLQYRVGAMYAENRWSLQLSFVHQSEETILQKRPQQYGSAMLSYRFH